MNVNLTPSLQDFVQSKIEQGGYASADEVIAAGLSIMQLEEDGLWKESAREKIEQGLESGRAGRVHELADVESWMAAQKVRWREVPVAG